MIHIKKLNESTLKIVCDLSDARTIQQHDDFVFFADNYRFNPKFRSGSWDGKIRLFDLRSSTLPIGCLFRLCKFLKSANMPYSVDEGLRLEKTYSAVNEQWISEFLKYEFNFDLELHDYQMAALLRMLKLGKCGTLVPTGGGKSAIQFAIDAILREFNPELRTLIIVPSIGLVEQMRSDFLDYTRNAEVNYDANIHMVFGGKSKESNKQIVISTWQSLMEMPVTFFREFGCVICDEFHLGKAKEISGIMGKCENAKYKFGLSGTLSDSKVDFKQLEALFGPIEKIVSTKTLMDRGVLSDLDITSVILNYPKEDAVSYRKELKAVEGNKQKYYHTEMEFIKNHSKRFRFIVGLARKLDGNSLILFRNVDYGRAIYEELLKDSTGPVYFVYGDIPGEDREKIRKAVDTDSNTKIVASIQIFSTGINIKSLKYLIMAQPTKSKIKVLQSIGRILRKHANKYKAKLFDIVDNITGKNYCMKHAVSRTEFYDNEEFEFTIKEVNL